MPINISVPFERLADDIEQELDRKYRAFWCTLYNNVNLLSPVFDSFAIWQIVGNTHGRQSARR